jgi:hypothetical protein
MKVPANNEAKKEGRQTELNRTERGRQSEHRKLPTTKQYENVKISTLPLKQNNGVKVEMRECWQNLPAYFLSAT